MTQIREFTLSGRGRDGFAQRNTAFLLGDLEVGETVIVREVISSPDEDQIRLERKEEWLKR